MQRNNFAFYGNNFASYPDNLRSYFRQSHSYGNRMNIHPWLHIHASFPIEKKYV